MKYLFYFGHPAQYLFLRETLRRLSNTGEHEITILIKTKDVLEELIKKDGFDYTNILTKQRGVSKLAILFSLFKRILLIIPIIIRKKPDLLVGTDATIAQLGKLFGINRITIIEDDYEVVKNLADLTYPFTQTILCPDVCQVGPWRAKKIGYKGYMKLGYLHPSIFTPSDNIYRKYNLGERCVLIRMARLTAYHDFGIRGINPDLLGKIIEMLLSKGYTVKISTESQIDVQFERYVLTIDPSDMHHVLSQAMLLICDSQSMSVEAAMLGVPSIRYSDFAGKISVLEELEHTYNLTFGILPGHESDLIAKIKDVIEQPDLKATFLLRRQKMLTEKIDVTSFLVWFLMHYPASFKVMKDSPDYQDKFKAFTISEV
ncbi:DUF354 domain-containing protein [Larkinella sp. GY13]|uniref:DUF354 domain-containing protein n=1 Tax=Larkinella sp. GY13 TaxID=3453720 RepID=UPI003EEEF866